VAAVPIWWATGVFIAAMTTDWFDGRVARGSGYSSPLGSLIDPVADKLLVLTVLILLIDSGVALVLTWLSGLDYARLAPGLLRGRTASP
jgi:CDP-diacylglycerol---glycerol-3-phosphate 3-phosphatidyltransferase